MQIIISSGKMGLYWIRVNPKSHVQCSCKESRGFMEKRAMWRRNRDEWWSYKPRNDKHSQEPLEARKSRGWSLRALPPWFWTLGLNSESINFCCVKPSSLWWFVVAALRKEYSGVNMHLGCMHQKLRGSNSWVLVYVCNTVTMLWCCGSVCGKKSVLIICGAILPRTTRWQISSWKLLVTWTEVAWEALGASWAWWEVMGRATPTRYRKENSHQAGSPGHSYFYADEIWLNQWSWLGIETSSIPVCWEEHWGKRGREYVMAILWRSGWEVGLFSWKWKWKGKKSANN